MDKVEVPRSSAPGPVDLEVLPRLESYRGHNRKDEETEFGSTITYDPVVQRSLLRKCDWFILPPLTFMYLCNALDKGNVANAKTDGWDKDIGLTGDQYYLLVMIFYVPFCLFGTPISIFVKKFSAARVLPLMMIGFGAMSLFTSIAKNFSQIFAIRWFLGIFESAMLPGVVYYLSTFYKRGELASRVGLFYAAAAIAGAFSGLIAFGVFQIKNPRHHAWQYLFWIEGSGTVTFALFAFFWLPRTSDTWWILTEEEKAVARRRILEDSSSEINEKFSFREAFRPFKNPLYWVWAMINRCKSRVFDCQDKPVHCCSKYCWHCRLATGASAPSVLVATWYNNNTPQESKRAVVTAVMVALANASGLISTNVFRAQDEPKYVPALATSAAFGGLCLILVASTGIWMRWENKRRDKVQGVVLSAGDIPTETLSEGPLNPSFRFMY
ncbi:high-affinity nicotinic acid transporter [Lentinula edodes]|uniref:High-affinity nicotinic acid transporter n=1 Tax=Lentinula edodes TaxID=5353 RepID=A0A1Q3E944_LENED|nr:high-affinity nicotinic acid transporter [Lentinula edodes]